jgi:hypothetical protein
MEYTFTSELFYKFCSRQLDLIQLLTTLQNSIPSHLYDFNSRFDFIQTINTFSITILMDTYRKNPYQNKAWDDILNIISEWTEVWLYIADHHPAFLKLCKNDTVLIYSKLTT